MRDKIAQAIRDICPQPDVDEVFAAADAVVALFAEQPTIEYHEATSDAGWFDFGERSGLLRPGEYAAVRLDDGA